MEKKEQQEKKIVNAEVGTFEKKQSFLQKWFAPLKDKKPRTDNKFFGFMQRLGGTFMLPVAAMSIAGVLLGVGSGFQSLFDKGLAEGATHSAGFQIFGFISMMGSFFFDLLPLAFTIAIPVGLASNNAGSAGFGAMVSYFGTLAGMNFVINIIPTDSDLFRTLFALMGDGTGPGESMLKDLLSFKVLDMSILGAIINGLIIWQLNEKLQYKKLPTFISFIGGKRLTPVLATLIFPLYGALMVFIWPWFGRGLYWMGIGFTYLGDFGPGLFIFISRLLCPTGLHHMFNALFNLTAVGFSGNIVLADGTIIEGTIGNVNAMNVYLSHNMLIPPNVSRWLTGAYILPILFGLPAAALAILLAAKKDQRPIIKAAIISGIIATIGGGITETIEFLFLFTAPILYVFHALMVGIGYIVFALFDVQMGQGGDIFVFISYGPIQGVATKWWLAFIVGPIDFAIYFAVFYFGIKKFHLNVIGQENNLSGNNSALANVLGTTNLPSESGFKKEKGKKTKRTSAEEIQARGYLKLINGWQNIESFTNCFTRLRITLKNAAQITDAQVKALGGIGLKKISDKNYQIICGAQVELVRHEMEKLKEKG